MVDLDLKAFFLYIEVQVYHVVELEYFEIYLYQMVELECFEVQLFHIVELEYIIVAGYNWDKNVIAA